ncbi:hypothetical protein [Deinococcus sonorensis]|uniref:Uncharacterized protein n=2 Tax=Deinococcus sonorensis TaxID=309891 RepID=A0AAU7UGU5_9DEIO
MTLKDLKNASVARQQAQPDEPQEKPGQARQAPGNDRMKMLGARVPISIHREFQTQLFRAQEQFPDLTAQQAMPVLVRLLRDESVWRKFMAELKKE